MATNISDYEDDLKADLLEGFEAIGSTPGSIAAWGALATSPPAGLFVDGVGPIALPLGEGQIRQLIAHAHQPTHGHGSETLLDCTSVRNTWEIDADQLSFLDPAWQAYLLQLSKTVASKLGILAPIRVELHKMVIYETGAMFKPQTDTEKTPGMFGTMIICLPSAHTGGEVVLKHDRESMTLTTSDATQSFACWYSDVSHELLRVHSGYRCILTYNLATWPNQARPTAEALSLQKVTLRNALDRWHRDSADTNATHVPSHLYHLLDHQYTEASMSLNALKAKDLARVRVLQGLTAERPFEIFLASVEKKEIGDVEPHDPDLYVDYDPECHDISEFEAEEASTVHEMIRVRKVSYTVKSLRTLDGTTIAKNYHFDTGLCLVDDPFEEMEITEEKYRAYMGQRSPTATHFYRRSALVMVPRHRFGFFLSACHEQQASSR